VIEATGINSVCRIGVLGLCWLRCNNTSPAMTEWNKEKALAALGIQEIAFTETNGNVQGYARK
jgi:hypothetical protein